MQPLQTVGGSRSLPELPTPAAARVVSPRRAGQTQRSQAGIRPQVASSSSRLPGVPPVLRVRRMHPATATQASAGKRRQPPRRSGTTRTTGLRPRQLAGHGSRSSQPDDSDRAWWIRAKEAHRTHVKTASDPLRADVDQPQASDLHKRRAKITQASDLRKRRGVRIMRTLGSETVAGGVAHTVSDPSDRGSPRVTQRHDRLGGARWPIPLA